MNRRTSFLATLAGFALLAAFGLAAQKLDNHEKDLEPALLSAGFVDRQPGRWAKNQITVTGPAGQRVEGSPLDDKLVDKSGGSVLLGGTGDDTYQLPDEKSHPVEQPGQGNDTVETWNSFRLPANIENLVLVGKYATGTASTQGSRLTSQGASNVLESGPGNDTLLSGSGAAATGFLFRPGSGDDIILNFRLDGPDHDYIRLAHVGFCGFAAVHRRMRRTATGDTILSLSARDHILIRGVGPEQLGPQHFLTCFSPHGMKMAFEDEFDRLLLYSRQNQRGRWKTAFAHGPADGPHSLDTRRLAGNHDEQIYVDPSYAGDPTISRAALRLNPFATHSGRLSIHAWRLSPTESRSLWGARFASGLLTTEPSFAQTYGYFEIRTELPQAKGLFPAFWLLPKGHSWPPEIDVFENVAQDFVTCGLIASGRRRAFFVRFAGGVKGMHRYGVLWTPQRIIWVFDGQEVGSEPTPPGLHQPMYMLVNLAVGGKWPGSPLPGFHSAKMKIDYVRAYRWEHRP